MLVFEVARPTCIPFSFGNVVGISPKALEAIMPRRKPNTEFRTARTTQLGRPARMKKFKQPKRDLSGDELYAVLAPRLASRVLVVDLPVERTNGRRSPRKNIPWKESRKDQFRPQEA